MEDGDKFGEEGRGARVDGSESEEETDGKEGDGEGEVEGCCEGEAEGSEVTGFFEDEKSS